LTQLATKQLSKHSTQLNQKDLTLSAAGIHAAAAAAAAAHPVSNANICSPPTLQEYYCTL
jgi:hypothetical protein